MHPVLSNHPRAAESLEEIEAASLALAALYLPGAPRGAAASTRRWRLVHHALLQRPAPIERASEILADARFFEEALILGDPRLLDWVRSERTSQRFVTWLDDAYPARWRSLERVDPPPCLPCRCPLAVCRPLLAVLVGSALSSAHQSMLTALRSSIVGTALVSTSSVELSQGSLLCLPARGFLLGAAIAPFALVIGAGSFSDPAAAAALEAHRKRFSRIIISGSGPVEAAFTALGCETFASIGRLLHFLALQAAPPPGQVH